MRVFTTFVLALLCVSSSARAQEADTAAAPRWEADLVGKLSSSQAGYRNWAKGGANTIAFTTALDGQARYEGDVWLQKYEVRLAFGLVKQDTLDVRKADDQIRLIASMQHEGDGFFSRFSPTLAAQLNTQFAAGFNYKKNPFNDGLEPPVKVSDFFSPATFTQSVGLSYDPAQWFTTRLGIGAKQTIVVIERFRSLYGVAPHRPDYWELGVESRTNLDREVFKNVHLKSTLGLFAAFNKPDMPDLLWENNVAMKVNSWLGVNFEFVTLYDRDINNLLQVKEVLSLSVTVVLI